MVLSEMKSLAAAPAILDIGCGSGFDDDLKLQQRIIAAAGQYVGVDPDAGEGMHFHRTLFENAPLPPDSIDLAFAVMVLEHIADPALFWQKLYSVLRDGGIFWGFTVDARHWFRQASTWSERLRAKDLYLTLLRGKRGVDRYVNYPTCYRTNKPAQIRAYTRVFRSVEFINFQRVGQLNYYLPRILRPLGHAIDRAEIAIGKPGMILAVRAVK
jgi:SAM-dependent methyltransferase